MRRPRNLEIPKTHRSRSSLSRHNWPIAEVELATAWLNFCRVTCDVMSGFDLRDKGVRKGSRVACRFVQAVPDYTNATVTYTFALPSSEARQHGIVASLTSSVNGNL